MAEMNQVSTYWHTCSAAARPIAVARGYRIPVVLLADSGRPIISQIRSAMPCRSATSPRHDKTLYP